MKKTVKRISVTLLCILLALLLVVGGYIAYVFIAYHRIGDLTLEVKDPTEKSPAIGETYEIISWNIGFGAYERDFGFFMDGGEESWAFSEERLRANLDRISERLKDESVDFYLLQEVDFDSTRTYHIDEREPISNALSGFCSVFAQNYDSPFLMYPLTQPHGASRSGIYTFSAFDIAEAERKSLPIETGFMKFLDLDRCYSKSVVPLEGGASLVIFNFHLSAYTSDGNIATEQLYMLLGDMQSEYEKGNYCIAGGDFNKDVLNNSSEWFNESDTEYTWAQPIPEETFDAFNVSIVAPINPDAPVPSCRNADGPYYEGQYVVTVDGFLVTDNITVDTSEVLDYGFEYSDHNPVKVSFKLD